MKWLLWLFCFDDVTHGNMTVQWPIHFPNLESPLQKLLFLVLAAVAVGMVFAFYRKEPDYVERRRKRLLTGLRAAGMMVILFILTGAFLELSRSEDSKGTLVLLVDSSLSMSIADRRSGEKELKDAARILGLPAVTAAADQARINQTSRSELVKKAMANPQIGLLQALGDRFKIEAYTFGQSAQLTPLELAATDNPNGPLAELGAPKDEATQLGSALRDTARRLKGRKIDGVVVFTDGGSNRGEDPLLAAQDLGAQIFPVGVGLPQTKDIEIPFLFAEDVVFKGDTFPLYVRIRQRGYTGRTVHLVVKRDDEIVKEESLELDEQLERMHTVDITPNKVGTFTYSAEIEPFDDEMSADNNHKAKNGLRVIDKKIRVLMVDDGPRWEFRFIRSVLEADKQRIEPSFVLRQADERTVQTDPHFKRGFPETMQELRNYDVIILGNIVADFFTKDELKNLETYVKQEGGGLLLIAGRNSLPDAYAGTPIENLFPVETDPQALFTLDDEMARSFKPNYRGVLTPEGQRSPVLRFAVDSAENEALWKRTELLCWFHPAKRLKPGATALLVHPTATGPDGPLPIIAQQRYGKGQVLYFATDETWRWRYLPGAQYYRRLWGQAISSLSMAHLLGKTNRIQLETDRAEYTVGEKATIIARVLDKDFNKLVTETVTAVIERGELNKDQVTLTAIKDQPGVFRGEYIPTIEGRFRLTILDEDNEAENFFGAVNPRIEFEDPGMRQEQLQAIANVSNGAFVALPDLADLGKRLQEQKRAPEVRREERSLWNAPGVMLLFTLLFGLEWFLRKRSDLL